MSVPNFFRVTFYGSSIPAPAEGRESPIIISVYLQPFSGVPQAFSTCQFRRSGVRKLSIQSAVVVVVDLHDLSICKTSSRGVTTYHNIHVMFFLFVRCQWGKLRLMS